MKKELKIQFLSSFLILTGIGFIAYFYMSHQTAMGGVYAINEHPERALSDPVNIEMEDMEKGDEVALLRIPALNKEYLTYWGLRTMP